LLLPRFLFLHSAVFFVCSNWSTFFNFVL
jgi:hypothetical protein